jgi:hypothetical protein
MSFADKLKSTKEKAVLGALGPAMRLIDDWTKDIKPENEVAAFVESNLGSLFEQQGDKANSIVVMLAKMAVAEANDKPEYVLHKMLRFYDALRVWYPEYQAR